MLSTFYFSEAANETEDDSKGDVTDDDDGNPEFFPN
jgi:hypothetical protein